jgi:dihydroorotate dehydrogenase electron transfer subunit
MAESAAANYADRAWHGPTAIVENVAVARDTYRVRVGCPELAARVVPGQFVMLRLAGANDPLLGRPLAVYDTVLDAAGEPTGIDLVYLVVGRMTRGLASLSAGRPLEVWGPLGNGFPPTPTEHLIMVAGGIGQTPFLSLAAEYLGRRQYGSPPRRVAPAARVTLCYGTRTADYLAGVEDFRRLGVDVRLSTDDGTAGHHGLVVDLIGPAVRGSPDACRIACCGPERMIEATARIAAQLKVPCEVSLETPMACGIGACFSCVTRVRDGRGGWDYRRTCVEGPVFRAEDIVWE